MNDRTDLPVQPSCPARALALDVLHGFSLPEACNVEAWLDRIETRNGREARP
ncbi:MAG: hypothetical protein ACU0B7_14010 [Paracoccaceae bacterium]|uniref:hypothetical protein n=1 Tax=Seohaeicola saemankumensis TaxID=481181 RepID=UPI001E39E3A9|nr:hypothetical protein [Seohaeicola saemankumensis]MCD1627219.1 hypothetical protein [Seohaeicola saemankumensis]